MSIPARTSHRSAPSAPRSLRWGARVLAVLMLLGIAACDRQVGTTTGGEDEEDEPPEGPTYENPVLARDFPDPSVLQAPDGTYYLFYSGDTCCGENAHYAVMVARADTPTGPFETLGDARGTHRSTILTADDTWKAPGHNAVVQDADGNDWIVYHAINRDRPTRATGTGARWDRRVMLMDRIRYDGGWPSIKNGEPSAAAPLPVVENEAD